MSNVSNQKRREIILQLLRIANISRDLDRSRDDSVHVAGDGKKAGKIVYVLDENVFEMFIRPFDYARNVETFYAEEWSSPRVDATVRRRYEAQSALIASEHLLFGDLPGNADDKLYMTEPHRWELFSRLTELTEEMRDTLNDRETLLIDLHTKLDALRGLAVQQPVTDSLLPYLNRTLLEDLDKDIAALKGERDSSKALDRIRATRIAAEILSTNTSAEPLDQLRRLTSESVRERIHDLQDKLECPLSARRLIAQDADHWEDALKRELQLPANRKNKRKRKSQALTNDALSIAYLRWAAKALAEKSERLIFITGDDLVFNAYRRWYSDPKTDVRAEPFYMRQATQFSPIFIPSDSGGDLSVDVDAGLRNHAIFDRFQEAIESTLIPIVLAEPLEGSDKASDGIYPKSRERLALKLDAMRNTPDDPDLAAFAEKLDSEFLSAQQASINDIRNLWQAALRTVIGASFNLLAGRLTAEQQELMKLVGGARDKEASEVLADYANKVLVSIVEESVQLWFPLAKEFLAGRGRDAGVATPAYRRLWPALDLRRQFPTLDFDRLPETVFAEAAISAIAIQDASNAARFARLALRAESANTDTVPGLREELRFLAAVSCRMLISTIDLSVRPSQDGLDDDGQLAFRRGLSQLKDLYSEASGYVHSLAAFHDAKFEEGPENDKPSHKIRYLRALSERASLNLFMATSIGLSRAISDIEKRGAEHYLELSRIDLRLCVLRDKRYPEDDLLDELLTSIRAQYAPNIAGYEVLAYILDAQDRSEQWPKVAYSRLRAFEAAQPRTHALLRAELAAFNLIQKISDRPLSAAEFVDGMDKLRLALDKTLYRRIFSGIFGVDTGKAMGMAR